MAMIIICEQRARTHTVVKRSVSLDTCGWHLIWVCIVKKCMLEWKWFYYSNTKLENETYKYAHDFSLVSFNQTPQYPTWLYIVSEKIESFVVIAKYFMFDLLCIWNTHCIYANFLWKFLSHINLYCVHI